MSFTSLPLTEINRIKLPAPEILLVTVDNITIALFAQKSNKLRGALLWLRLRKAEKIIRDAYRYQRRQKVEQQQN